MKKIPRDRQLFLKFLKMSWQVRTDTKNEPKCQKKKFRKIFGKVVFWCFLVFLGSFKIFQIFFRFFRFFFRIFWKKMKISKSKIFKIEKKHILFPSPSFGAPQLPRAVSSISNVSVPIIGDGGGRGEFAYHGRWLRFSTVELTAVFVRRTREMPVDN